MGKLSENIKTYRKKHNLSQSEFAKRLYITKQAVSKWETGKGYPDSALIPLIAKELGISIDTLMGEKRTNNKMIIFIAIMTIFIFASIIFTPSIVNKYKEINKYNEYTNNIESLLELELPDKGILVFFDFQGWIIYGNSIPVNQMSYLVFNDTNQTRQFELDLHNDSKWITTVNLELMASVPVNIQEYTDIGDYYLIYNIGSESYNDSTVESGTYEYLLLIYQLDSNRLIIFDYSIYIEGGE